ncbi:D-alanyl-D-alanine dipeptidase [termite gut metagenome]|uniref:D-alanyl-D-alanine dipeptidase n=2 Tax=termite gut metagenome TaxID=433724 RepID=A0A5J4S9L4_9ZZZZ
MFIRFSKILFIALLFLSTDLQIAAQTEKPTYSLKSKTAIYFESVGLVNVREMDESISVRLIYATSDNFTGRILYEDLKEAYLHPDAAKALVTAQRNLKSQHPSYTLVVYDASRPISIQWKMWETVKGTSGNIYVANPVRGGGLHNYGVAVDVSILNAVGNPLPMGTEVDYFGIEAHIANEAELVRQGKITSEEWKNRLLLRQVMREGGFHTISSEWWHFNLCSRETAKQKYVLIK